MVIQNKYTNRYIQDYKEGKISQKEAATKTRNIYRGGGGSSSSAVSAAEARGRAAAAAQEAKRKAEEESRKKAIEELKIKNAQILKDRKQQKISSQKIGGQLNQTNQTNKLQPGELVVDVYNPEDKYTTPGYRQSFGASAGMAIKSFGSNLFNSLRGKETLKPIKNLQMYSNILKDLKEMKLLMLIHYLVLQ